VLRPDTVSIGGNSQVLSRRELGWLVDCSNEHNRRCCTATQPGSGKAKAAIGGYADPE